VLWKSTEALKAYFDWEERGAPYEEETADLDYSSFTKPIADDFDHFLTLLQSES
jgi:hypothetical protein